MPQKTVSKLVGQPRNLIIIFLAVALLMISSALIELNQSKRELQELMDEQSHSLLESLIIASRNILRSNEYLTSLYQERLLNNAKFIRLLYESDKLTDTDLIDIAQKNRLHRINIFDRSGRKMLSNHEPEHSDLPERHNPINTLRPIFRGQVDTLIIGLRPARYEDGYRYSIAISAKNNSAIVLNVDGAELLRSRRETGFGVLLRTIVLENDRIEFACLQDTSTILAAAGNISQLEPITSSDFLFQSYNDSIYSTRISEFDTLAVFEAVHPFHYSGSKVGLFRLGLSAKPLQDINARIYRRLLIITIILILVGSLIFTFIFVRQRYDLLQKQYQVVDTYSGNIIENVSDGIIVYHERDGIQIFNQAVSKLFDLPVEQAVGKHYYQLDVLKNFPSTSDENSGLLREWECSIGDQKRHLLISRSDFRDADGIKNTIMVIRDLTEQKELEAQLERKKRLTAMGELAAGVAHEIRNPLNAIGTIVQQLDKDFEPQDGNKEYHDLAGLVESEVKRINKTVQDFLRFSRPEPIQPIEFELDELVKTLAMQYKGLAAEKNIQFTTNLEWNGLVFWDQNQIKQVFTNLLQNAFDALQEGNRVELTTHKINDNEIGMIVSDDGPGMSKEVKERVFNLYYTTKAEGTGIGLSIVQRIIDEHGGTINLETAEGKGTSFEIVLPIRYNSK